jgi:putative transposase
VARLQKRLSKKLKGSNNAKEARLKVARLHNKISDSRKDFLHKLSTKLINENDINATINIHAAGLAEINA